VIGDPELKAARFATNDDRIANYKEFRARMDAALATATTATWVGRMEEAQIAAGPIYEFDEVFADSQVQHLGLIAEFDQPGLGPTRVLNFPARASAAPASIRRPALSSASTPTRSSRSSVSPRRRSTASPPRR
jgi:crotonobetainyl-CoA:carnitine CoA-transferase CaiB-like acyl-CoA transferase